MIPITRRRVLAAVAGGTAFGLAGCLSSDGDGTGGSDSDSPGRAELGSPAQTADVTTTSRPSPHFSPRIVHVEVGGTVTWTNEDGRHDVTSYHPDTHGPQRIPDGTEPWASDQLSAPGQSFERTFDREGVYDYADTRHVCTSHEVVGAVGRVVVGWPDPDPEREPGLAEPQPALPTQAANAIERLNEETRPVLEDRA